MMLEFCFKWLYTIITVEGVALLAIRWGMSHLADTVERAAFLAVRLMLINSALKIPFGVFPKGIFHYEDFYVFAIFR